jgi:hypothetical protein
MSNSNQHKTRPSVREAILICVRRRGIEVGDGAMITPSEYGFWVGSEYVAKSEVSRVCSDAMLAEREKGAK